jgi:phosphohistidine phosphatase
MIIENPSIYEATTQDLLNIINSIGDENNSAMLFGHNPVFTVLANLIADKYINNMPTCGVAIIDLDVESWKEVNANCGKLVGFEYPKKY